MKVIYFTNDGKEKSFERATLNECISAWVATKAKGNANWGHVYISGVRHWL